MEPYLRNNLRFNEQLTTKGLASGNLEHLRGANIDTLVLVGMGGSALAGEILRGVAHEIGLHLPVVIWKDYDLPKLSASHKKPFYVFASFSGNTEETLSGLKALLKAKKKVPIGVVATGGELLRLARENNISWVSFPPSDLTPRQSTGRMFYSVIELLRSARLITKRVPEFTTLKPLQWKRSGSVLARRLKRKLIVIYSEAADQYLGYLWKIKFNETAKVPAFNNVLPEMNHNEIVGFEQRTFPTVALMLTEEVQKPRLHKKFQVTEYLLHGHGIEVIRIPVSGKTKLERTWKTIMFGDSASYALAELNHTDPAETRIITRLKAAMRKK